MATAKKSRKQEHADMVAHWEKEAREGLLGLFP